MTYWWWLAGASLLFVLLERLRPWRRAQRVLRPGWVTDLGYLVLNGHFFGLWLALATRPFLERVQGWAESNGVGELVFAGIAESWNPFAQFLVAYVALDFVQWCVHVALHRFAPLWAFHRVHHSVRDMDWAGSFRFHVAETLFYKSAMFLPLVWFGFGSVPLFAVAVVGTVQGHFNHANVDVDIGWLGRIFNNPRMHLWHHHDEAGRGSCNYGISLSVWDWLFGTAYVPSNPPSRLGFSSVETYPRSLPGQLWRGVVDAVRALRGLPPVGD